MTDTTRYAHDFYDDRHAQTGYAAERMLALVAEVVPPIRSAVDIGCGVGTWLSVLANRGVERLQGFDGPWVADELLEIRRDQFARRDLSKEIARPDQRYDLAISLEVAEHLPADSADTFVRSLTNQSDFVLFSAAIPHQGGKHHVNEQWIEYWVDRFQSHDYVGLDVLRMPLWSDERIQRWYRQNAVLFAARTRVPELTLPRPCSELAPVSLVHPRTLEYRFARQQREKAKSQSLKGSWTLFRRALRQSVGGR
ncbi:class I SAM-dependent methyltransferase [Salinisphaera sp. T31B1]|uniref:class I SAM-dependent methyltransferase n=1 Tax=Salinisphaera sp. T31B1 TaxID=727963 RepID=UPI003342766F